MTTDTTVFGFTRPSLNDDGPGWATQMNACIEEIDAKLAIEHAAAGTHGAITPTSIVCAGDITLGTDDDFIKGTTAGLLYVRSGVADTYNVLSASWDSDEKSASTGTINWNSVFAVPAIAKAVDLLVMVVDSDITARPSAALLKLQASSTTTVASIYAYATDVVYPNAGWNRAYSYRGVVPVAADGTSYYAITVSDTGHTLGVYIYVCGYYI